MIKVLTSPWMTLPAGAVVYLASALVFWKTPAPPPPPSAGPEKNEATGPSWEFINPEGDQLITALRDEKKALAAKQQELDDLAARLQAERAELTSVTQVVARMQVDFDKMVVRVGDDEQLNLKKLAKVYADLSPDAAAKVMAKLEDGVIVKIMLFMKENETAAIIEILAKDDPTRAAAISEHLRLSTTHKDPAK